MQSSIDGEARFVTAGDQLLQQCPPRTTSAPAGSAPASRACARRHTAETAAGSRSRSIRMEAMTMLQIALYIHVSTENSSYLQSENYSYRSRSLVDDPSQSELHAHIVSARA
jgi:hypothetical protein